MIRIITTLSAILAFNLFAMDAHAGCATKSQARAAYPTSYLKYSVRNGRRCWIAPRVAKRDIKKVRRATAEKSRGGVEGHASLRLGCCGLRPGTGAAMENTGLYPAENLPVLAGFESGPRDYIASNFPDLRPDEEVRKDFRTVIVERFTPLPKPVLTEQNDPDIWPKKAEWAHEGPGKYSIVFAALGMLGALTFGTALGLRRRK